MDRILADLVAAQHGLVRTAQARAVGADSHVLTQCVRSGQLVRVRHGVYADAQRWRTAAPWQRYALQVRAVALSRPRSVLAQQAALAAYELPLFDVSLNVVHVREAGSAGHRSPGLVVMPLADEVPTRQVDDLTVLDPAFAIREVLMTGGLLPGLVAADAALHRGLVTRADLEAITPPPGARGARRMAQLVAQADPRCESPGETRTRSLLVGLGLRVRSQVVFASSAGPDFRVDFVVEDHVIVEFDGAVKYSGADGREALIAEKRREDRLRALGFHVVRLTWHDLADPGGVGARIRAVVAQGPLTRSTRNVG